jgi:hypothetical protein
MVNYNKPLSISLLAFLLFLLSIVVMIFAVHVFFYEEGFWDYGLLSGIASETHRMVAVIILNMFIIGSGIGLLKSASWGRWLFISLCLLGIAQGVVVAFSDSLRGAGLFLICLFLIIYMFTSRVADVFKPIYSRKAVDAIEALDSYRKSRF